ncbi:hypothetical protein ACFL6Y_08295 [Elusimicrobiota bacterium]
MRSITALVAGCFLLYSSPVLCIEDGADGGIVHFGKHIKISADQNIKGDVVVFGGSIRALGNIDGDVVVLGGNAEINGHVEGDTVVLGGELKLGPQAIIEGALTVLGGHLDKSEAASVHGETVEMPGFNLNLGSLSAAAVPMAGFLAGMALWMKLLSSLGWLALALLAGLLFPKQLAQTASCVEAKPGLCILLGILFWPALIVLSVMLLISIIGIPILPLVALGMVTLWFWSYVSIGYWMGSRMLKNQTGFVRNDWFLCVLGLFVIVLISWIPIIGWLASMAVLFFGIGATILSRFGTKKISAKHAKQA